MSTLTTLAPVVSIIDGKPVTTSLDIAKHFNKQHKTVLRAVDNLDCSHEYHQRNFVPTAQLRKNPSGGEPIQSRQFTITRDGFVFLCMGFTGREAAKWKEAYIAAFNAMEAHLLRMNNLPVQQTSYTLIGQTIGTDGFHVLGSLVAGKVRTLPSPVQRRATMKIWAQVHAAFNVRSAEDIPAISLDSARNFIAAYAIEGELLKAERRSQYHYPIDLWQPTNRVGLTGWLTYEEMARMDGRRPLEQLLDQLKNGGSNITAAEAEYMSMNMLLKSMYGKMLAINQKMVVLEHISEEVGRMCRDAMERGLNLTFDTAS